MKYLALAPAADHVFALNIGKLVLSTLLFLTLCQGRLLDDLFYTDLQVCHLATILLGRRTCSSRIHELRLSSHELSLLLHKDDILSEGAIARRH